MKIISIASLQAFLPLRARKSRLTALGFLPGIFTFGVAVWQVKFLQRWLRVL